MSPVEWGGGENRTCMLSVWGFVRGGRERERESSGCGEYQGILSLQ